MIKLYCDRCGKEIERFNERRYEPIVDAANGEDTFFAINIYSKHTYKPLHPLYGDCNTGVDDDEAVDKARYELNTPDLCIDCMRKINEAVKTVWDGTPNWEKEAES